MLKHFCALLALGLFAACGSSTDPDPNDPNTTPEDKASIGYRLLRGINTLDSPRTGVMRMYSSHNGNDASNFDYNQYMKRDPDGSYVMLDHSGPGVITRLWMTARIGTSLQDSRPGFSNNAVLKVYLDGSATPLISINPNRFFAGELFPFVYPLVNQHDSPTGTDGKGFYSYVPISFSQSAKITLTNPFPPGAPYPTERLFYQINLLELPAQTVVPVSPVRQTDGSLSLSEDDTAAHAEAIAQWNDPVGFANRMTEAKEKVLFAGPVSGTVTVADLTGPGRIVGLRLLTGNVSPADLEKVRLKIRWDNKALPDIDIPLATAWGCYYGRSPFQGLALGANSDGVLYLRLPMPFRQAAKIELQSSALGALPISAEVYYNKQSVAADARYLHATFQNATVPSHGRFFMAEASGAGHVVGLQLVVHVNSDPQALEGDEFLITDGAGLFKGTGTEDFFNAHWFFEGGLRGLPLHGTSSVGPRLTPRVHTHRFLVPDAAPFGSNFRFELENGNAPGNQDAYRSVVFYYLNS